MVRYFVEERYSRRRRGHSRDIVDRQPAFHMIFRAMKAANSESRAQGVAVGEREPRAYVRAGIAGGALLAAVTCFPALAQSSQPGSQYGIPDMPAAGPAGWFWTLEEWRPTLSSPDGRF